ncbi:MAG: hypothetical protein B6229_03780 [Spirochaetaceae bacterium 4572_7]|nr:MAG: hypothetical protein B6229_03780 [Spirochaetaceae bacterium 4572_7]
MYYPYLRGKQFELILIRDNAESLAENSIHPIIEPVKSDFKAMKKAMQLLHEYNTNCTLIINPIAGETPVTTDSIVKELIDGEFKEYTNISLGFILHADSDIFELKKYLERYKDRSFSIIHNGFTNAKEVVISIKDINNIARHIFIDGTVGKLYISKFKTDKTKQILIRNGFKPQKKNSLYPLNEHFSDLHITYNLEGMDGFGDYLIVGDEYKEGGGPAYAVAIHLTYCNGEEEDDMFIYHFVSESTDSPTDPGGKFLEALKKLVMAVEDSKTHILKTSAIDEYLKLYEKKHYPGLGSVKKLSMQHHLELMIDYLERSNN